MKNPRLILALLSLCLAALPANVAAISPPKTAAPAETYPLPLGAKTAEGFDDPDHAHFFRYQAFLKKSGLDGLDADAWKKLSPVERVAKMRDGEDFLKKRFEQLLSASRLDQAETALLLAVWGPQVQAAAEKLATTRQLGDPAQVKQALAAAQGALKGLNNKLIAPDWDRLFDGGERRADSDVENAHDYLRVTPGKGSFQARLESAEVQRVLASRQSFRGYLQEKAVPPAAVPGMMAAYDVLSKAAGDNRAETAHILPTMVTFLADGKRVVLSDLPGALGYAVPGPYDRPEKVGVTPALAETDPIIAGKTLAHEFQHIYDMYVGRYYTLDSEMRGFKTAVLYYQILGQAAPEKLAALRDSDDDRTRGLMRDQARVDAAYAAGAEPFAREVAFNHGYSEWSEGVFQGRTPLRDVVDPNFGAARQLAALDEAAANARREVGELEQRVATLERRMSTQASRELDREYEKAMKDLSGSRSRLNASQTERALMSIRLRRMQAEFAWASKRSTAQGGNTGLYSLSLPVDRSYSEP